MTRDHFVPTKFYDWRGKIHCVNICSGEEGICTALDVWYIRNDKSRRLQIIPAGTWEGDVFGVKDGYLI